MNSISVLASRPRIVLITPVMAVAYSSGVAAFCPSASRAASSCSASGFRATHHILSPAHTTTRLFARPSRCANWSSSSLRSASHSAGNGVSPCTSCDSKSSRSFDTRSRDAAVRESVLWTDTLDDPDEGNGLKRIDRRLLATSLKLKSPGSVTVRIPTLALPLSGVASGRSSQNF